jgi:hypothetical protein
VAPFQIRTPAIRTHEFAASASPATDLHRMRCTASSAHTILYRSSFGRLYPNFT